MYKFDNLMDSSSSFAEVYSASLEEAVHFDVKEVDKFDSVSLPASLDAPQKKEVYSQLEMILSNGMIWETEVDDFIPNLEVTKSFYYEAVTSRERTISNSSLEKVLDQFDNWAGTPLDILSTYGDIDYGYNIFAQNFTMDLPVKIYSKDDDLVFKLEAPWMKIDTFKDVELYPSNLNLKSVLSVLPVKINSKELRASFVNGEFRLEVPKSEVALHKEKKDA